MRPLWTKRGRMKMRVSKTTLVHRSDAVTRQMRKEMSQHTSPFHTDNNVLLTLQWELQIDNRVLSNIWAQDEPWLTCIRFDYTCNERGIFVIRNVANIIIINVKTLFYPCNSWSSAAAWSVFNTIFSCEPW